MTSTEAKEKHYEEMTSLTEEDIVMWRSRAEVALKQLDDDELLAANDEEPQVSWMTGEILPNNDNTTTTSQQRFLNRNGFLLKKQFCTQEQVNEMLYEMEWLVEKEFDPITQSVHKFSTDPQDNENLQGSDDYFLESSYRIHYFSEPSAVHPETGELLQPFVNRKIHALNKVGHALHTRRGTSFHSYTTSSKMKNLIMNELKWMVDPVVPQSMYILKQPKIGGPVHTHQDSTFLYTEPKQTCLGLWLSLHNSTLDNGCLWVRPKSHTEPLRRQFKRNIRYFGSNAIEERSNIGKGDDKSSSEPKMILEQLNENEPNNAPWEGRLPTREELLDNGWIPIECNSGDLLIFVGTLDHFSLPNITSNSPRHTFQLHMVEGQKAGITWSKWNWLQYPKNMKFLQLNNDDDDESTKEKEDVQQQQQQKEITG